MKPQEEIEQLAEQYTQDGIYLSDSEKQQTEIAYMTGYKQCQQDMIEKYTEQDMIKFAFDTYYQEDMAKKYTKKELENAFNSGRGYGVPDDIKDFNSFINSLNKQDNE
jgi:hypothetical protein